MKPKPVKIHALLALLAGLGLFSSCSTAPDEHPTAAAGSVRETVTFPDGSRMGIRANTATATASVVSVDPDTRIVMLRRQDGSLAACVCGPEIRNFSQIKVGDVLKVTLTEELAVMLSKDPLPQAGSQSSVITRAKEGDKPGGRVVNTISFTARVGAIDANRRLVTLRTSDGQSRTVRVHPEISLANVNPGDDVGVRITQSAIVTVREP